MNENIILKLNNLKMTPPSLLPRRLGSLGSLYLEDLGEVGWRGGVADRVTDDTEGAREKAERPARRQRKKK